MQLHTAIGQIEEAFGQAYNETLVYKFGKAHPELSRAGIRFLTTKRTPAGHAAMVKQLVTRPCNCRLCELSSKIGYSVGDGKQIVGQAVTFLANLINGQLEKLHQHKFRSEHAGKGSSAQSWPQRPDDLLPFGVKDSIEALSQWVSGDVGCEPAIFTLTGKLSTFYQPFAKAVLSPPFTLALKLPIQHLENAMNRRPDSQLTTEENAKQFVTEARGVVSLFNSFGVVDQSALNAGLFPMGE